MLAWQESKSPGVFTNILSAIHPMLRDAENNNADGCGIEGRGWFSFVILSTDSRQKCLVLNCLEIFHLGCAEAMLFLRIGDGFWAVSIAFNLCNIFHAFVLEKPLKKRCEALYWQVIMIFGLRFQYFLYPMESTKVFWVTCCSGGKVGEWNARFIVGFFKCHHSTLFMVFGDSLKPLSLNVLVVPLQKVFRKQTFLNSGLEIVRFPGVEASWTSQAT